MKICGCLLTESLESDLDETNLFLGAKARVS